MWAIDSMSRAPRRPSQVLLPKGRMNFLTTRAFLSSRPAFALQILSHESPCQHWTRFLTPFQKDAGSNAKFLGMVDILPIKTI